MQGKHGAEKSEANSDTQATEEKVARMLHAA